MKQLLFLLLFPSLALAQYQGNANQKITLGEQTTADGLVYRGIRADTSTKIVPFSDTSAYIILDTVEKTLWLYKAGQVPKWQQVGGSAGGGGGVDSTAIAYVNTYGTQTVNGAKTFTSAVTATRFNPTANTATGTGMFLPAANSLGLSTNDIKRLEINETGATTLTNSSGITNGNGLNLRSGGNSPSDANVLNFTSNTGTINVSMFSDAANSNTRLKSLGNLSLHTGNIGISADNERITILSTGNVGIGTASPVDKLDVSGGFKISKATFVAPTSGSGLEWSFRTDNIGYLTAYDRDNALYRSLSIGVANFNVDTDADGDPNFTVRQTSGEAWIGYTTDQGAYRLQVNGQIFATNATIATSDEKFKENITPLNKGLEIVNKLKPVTFNFISDTENNFSQYEEVGFIAQDVDRALSTETFSKSIVKAADDSEPTSTMGLATQNLIPILVKAIQEQQALIKALEQRILSLENK